MSHGPECKECKTFMKRIYARSFTNNKENTLTPVGWLCYYCKGRTVVIDEEAVF